MPEVLQRAVLKLSDNTKYSLLCYCLNVSQICFRVFLLRNCSIHPFIMRFLDSLWPVLLAKWYFGCKWRRNKEVVIWTLLKSQKTWASITWIILPIQGQSMKKTHPIIALLWSYGVCTRNISSFSPLFLMWGESLLENIFLFLHLGFSLITLIPQDGSTWWINGTDA